MIYVQNSVSVSVNYFLIRLFNGLSHTGVIFFVSKFGAIRPKETKFTQI